MTKRDLAIGIMLFVGLVTLAVADVRRLTEEDVRFEMQQTYTATSSLEATPTEQVSTVMTTTTSDPGVAPTEAPPVTQVPAPHVLTPTIGLSTATRAPSTAQARGTQTPSQTVKPTPTMTVVPPTASPTPQLVNVQRLVIASIGVDAPVETIVVGADNVLAAPHGPIHVGWYDFSARPVESNLVFAGHVDYANHGPAVFWHLGDVRQGDIIDVYADNGEIFSYRVTALQSYDANEDARDVVGPTNSPTITLITCDGTFDPSISQYDKRLVVVGELITQSD